MINDHATQRSQVQLARMKCPISGMGRPWRACLQLRREVGRWLCDAGRRATRIPRGHAGGLMIFITAKFQVRPEDADRWPQIAAEFTEATRKEPGCLWFDWSRSIADPDEDVLVEAFRDGEAGGGDVSSGDVQAAQGGLPPSAALSP